MKTQPNAAQEDHDEADHDATERRLPVADGGYGPLDSGDIAWLIESGTHWMPGKPTAEAPTCDAA